MGFVQSLVHKFNKAILDHFRVDAKTRAKNMSRGERAGLCLALALAPEPDLLMLDDPAIGLDPVARRSLLESLSGTPFRSDSSPIPWVRYDDGSEATVGGSRVERS